MKLKQTNASVHLVQYRHRRRLYVSGTGTEGAEKRRDVDGVEWVQCRGCPLSSRLGVRRDLPCGEFFNFLSSWARMDASDGQLNW